MTDAGANGSRSAEHPDDGTDPPRRRTFALRLLAVAGLLAMALFWIWAFSGLPDTTPPDYIEDRRFPEAAEPICAAAQARIDALPKAPSATSFDDRADQIDSGSTILRTMIEDLNAVVVAGPEQQFVVAWLTDWTTYVDDRDRYATILRDGQDPPFTVTAKGGDQITIPIDNFAIANDMDSCRVPLDV